jgi:FmdE, Molybdenum formylmethanofuran dehydrogenase operon
VKNDPQRRLRSLHVRITVSALVALVGCTGTAPEASPEPSSRPTASALERVAAVHGGVGPFAVAGYRMGEHALTTLGRTRGEWGIEVVHESPDSVQWSCIVDGLQASTGTSLGRLTLRRERSELVESVVIDQDTGRRLVYGLTEEFLMRYLDLPPAQLDAAGREVLDLPAADVFWVREE